MRGSERHLVINLDIAKEKHNAFFRMATGKTLLRRLIFDNSIEEFEKLLIQAETLRVEYGLEEVVSGPVFSIISDLVIDGLSVSQVK